MYDVAKYDCSRATCLHSHRMRIEAQLCMHGNARTTPHLWICSSTGSHARGHLAWGASRKTRAKQLVGELDDDKPSDSLSSYVRALAALAALYPDEMKRKTFAQSRTIGRMLWCATAADRVQWLFNGCRLRRLVDRKMIALLGSGTSPNESLHAEMNRWFRNQPTLFSTTLTLQLSVCHLGKLIAHNAAMYRPTLRLMDQQSILHVCSQTIRFTDSLWQIYCSCLLRGEARLHQSLLPLNAERQAISERVHEWVLKRPARALKRPAARLKRTP